MSCIAILCDPANGLVFAGDGVAYDPADGKITALVSKIILMPELDCFLAAVGMGGLGAEFYAVVQPYGLADFDDLLDNFPDLAKEAYRIARWRFEVAEEIQSTLVIGGWSNRNQRYEMHRICAKGRDVLDLVTGERMADAPAWTPVHIEGRPYISAFPDPEVAERFGLGGPQTQYSIDWCARVICGCRASSGPSRYDEGTIYQVGGFLQLAWINRQQMRTWIAHRWPEQIGGTVDPIKGDPMPTMPIVVP